MRRSFGNKFVEDSAVTFLRQVASFPLAIAASILLARLLGPEGKGVFSVVILVPTLIVMAGNLGIGMANVYVTGKRRYTPKEIIGNSLSLSLGLGILFVVLAYLLYDPLLHKVLRGVDRSHVMLAILSVPFFLMRVYSMGILQGKQKIKLLNLVLFLDRGSFFLLLFFFLLLNRSIRSATQAWIISVIATSFISVALVCRPRDIKISMNFRLLRDSLIYGIKAHVGSVLQFFNYRLDIFIVNYFCGAREVGYYSIAVGASEVIWYIAHAFAIPLFPKSVVSEKESADAFAAKVTRNVFFLTIMASIVLALLAGVIINVAYSSKFYPSLLPLRILLFGIVALSLSKVLASHLAGRGKPQYGTYLTIVSLIFTLILDFTLIPRWGKVGAAVATSVAYSIAGGLAVYWFRKESGKGIREFLVINRADVRYYNRLLQKLIGR